MLLPVALLLLTNHASGSPTLVELINSGLSIIGAKYVPPPSGESKQGENDGTRQTACRDCSRQGRLYWDVYGTTTSAPPLPCCPGTNVCARCGVEKTRRVIGGVETAAGVYPWIAALRLSPNGQLAYCSGTLVSSKWAITAAHCIVGSGPTSLVLGEHDITSSNDAEDTNRREVSVSVIVHPDYDSHTTNNDIALLKLVEEVDLSIYTPACLPASSADYVGQTAKVYGWGKTDPCGTAGSAKLMEAEVEIVSDAACESSTGLQQCSANPATVGYSGQITDQMLCASATGKDACQGDSGGPLTVKDSDQHHLAGVVSWGAGCAADGLPGVYAEVAKFRTWVDATVAANGGIGVTCDA